ncbi:MAG: Lrp/AsnC family transcriptional regulator [Gammaproteobacteria bacterium]|nr:Lrp/AsnC family transcriptional regulator [Gammaproteobacteria bacterium]
MNLTLIEKRLLNEFQHNFPLTARPYAEIASRLDVSEEFIIETLDKLHKQKAISRVGAVFTPNRIGVSTLAAMSVPEDELEKVADMVSGYVEVNHNYEREHDFNLWFVLTATDDQHLQTVLQDIEAGTGYKVMSLPLLEDYHIDLGFNLQWT